MKPLRILMAAAMISAAAVSVQGCNSIMSKDECLNTNWEARGENDGIAGKASSIISEYHEACDDYRPMDESSYRRGRERGAKAYCVPERLYNTGVAGTELTDICSSVPGSAELMVYYQRGQMVYLAQQQLDTIDGMVQICSILADKGRWQSRRYRILEIGQAASKVRPKAKAALDKVRAAGMKKDVAVPDLLEEMKSSGMINTVLRYADADQKLDEIEKKMADHEKSRENSRQCMYSPSKKPAKSCSESYDYYSQQISELRQERYEIWSQVGI